MSALGAGRLVATDFKARLVARDSRRKAARKRLLIALSLTSMVDMFSLLVIFLLQTFSTSPEMLVVARNVALPQSRTGTELRDAPVLALAKDEVFLDQKPVGRTDALLRDPEPLLRRLKDLRERWQRAHAGQPFPGELNLQADKDLSSAVVSRIMAFLPSQHYGSVHLAVVSGGPGG